MLALAGVVLHYLLYDDHRLASAVDAGRAAAVLIGSVPFVATSIVSGMIGLTPVISFRLNLTLVAAALLGVALVLWSPTWTAPTFLSVSVASSVTATPAGSRPGRIGVGRAGRHGRRQPAHWGAFADPNESGRTQRSCVVLALVLVCGDRWWEVGGGRRLPAPSRCWRW